MLYSILNDFIAFVRILYFKPVNIYSVGVENCFQIRHSFKINEQIIDFKFPCYGCYNVFKY